MAETKTGEHVELQGASGQNDHLDNAQQVLLKYTRCVHCQARLHFSYLTDFSRNLTQETARCPECQSQAHQVMHRLQ